MACRHAVPRVISKMTIILRRLAAQCIHFCCLIDSCSRLFDIYISSFLATCHQIVGEKYFIYSFFFFIHSFMFVDHVRLVPRGSAFSSPDQGNGSNEVVRTSMWAGNPTLKRHFLSVCGSIFAMPSRGTDQITGLEMSS